MINEYADSDIFVLPSVCEENSGLVLLEAMSLGLPLITTNIGGQSELVIDGYNGFLIPPNDHVNLAKKIGIIIDNEELRNKLSYNSKKMSEKYSAYRHMEKITQLFMNLVRFYSRHTQ